MMNQPGFGPVVWSSEPEPLPVSTLETVTTTGTFTFPSGGQHTAQVRLHKVQDSNNLFWFGVAEFSPVPADFPGSANPHSGKVVFPDGLGGGVSFRAGKLSSTSLETGFIGLSGLVPQK